MKNGFPYIRPDNCTPILSVEDNIDKYINTIFKKHGQDYLEGNSHRSTSNENSTANDDPFKFEEEHVYEGQGIIPLETKLPFFYFIREENFQLRILNNLHIIIIKEFWNLHYQKVKWNLHGIPV